MSPLLLLWILLVDVVLTRNECFSCMSSIYRSLFAGGQSPFFFEPAHFSDDCDDPMDRRVIASTPCNTICLTLTQDLILMGHGTGQRLTMRGCASTMSRHGIVNRTLSIFDRHNLCRVIKVSELFRHDSSSQPVLVCSCLGHRCNSAPSHGSSSLLNGGLWSIMVSVMLVAKLYSSFNQQLTTF